MWYPHHGFGWETMLFGGLMMVLFWGVLIALIVWLFRAYVVPNANRERTELEDYNRSSNRALDILKERYARGEINRTEYLEMREDLSR